MNTVLITGCSSGFGLETARFFLDRDWTVIATMRQPREDLLPASPRLRVLPLDVTDAASIARAVEAAGPIDVLVNNAGVGMVGPLEGLTMEKIRELFETNTLGTIAMTQAVIPQLRAQGSGVIVNVTSGVTFQPLPLMSIYTASKAAVNAFSESVALELAPLGIRVRIVIPGRAPETPFGDNARGRMGVTIPEAYASPGRPDDGPLPGRRPGDPLPRRRRSRLARRDGPGLPHAAAGGGGCGGAGGFLIERASPIGYTRLCLSLALAMSSPIGSSAFVIDGPRRGSRNACGGCRLETLAMCDRWARACRNCGSTTVPVTGCTSSSADRSWWWFSAVATSRARRGISKGPRRWPRRSDDDDRDA